MRNQYVPDWSEDLTTQKHLSFEEPEFCTCCVCKSTELYLQTYEGMCFECLKDEIRDCEGILDECDLSQREVNEYKKEIRLMKQAVEWIKGERGER